MIINPIIPIWLMLIISIITITYIILKYKTINKKTIIRISIILLLFSINIRPMIKKDDVSIASSNLNILFVFDTTLSMNAEDSKEEETRILQAKKDCNYIMEKFPDANYSIITFSNGNKIGSKIEIPFTTDQTMVKNTIDVITTIDELYANSSSLNIPQDNMKKVLENARNKNNNLNILFFISDGEITDESKLKSYSNIKEFVDGGAVLGYGTTDGGYMQYINYNGKKEYVTYYDKKTYKEIKGKSYINEDNLKNIAKDIDIDYIHMEKQSNIDSLIKKISKNSTSRITDKKQEAYDDLYYFLTIPLLILLFLIYKEYKEDSV